MKREDLAQTKSKLYAPGTRDPYGGIRTPALDKRVSERTAAETKEVKAEAALNEMNNKDSNNQKGKGATTGSSSSSSSSTTGRG
jgi:hypothetical protein